MTMEIKLKNIGLIEESEIKLDGLTVITGRNNSGKTTVGKVLFSLIDAVSEIEKKSQNDIQDFISDHLEDISQELNIFRMDSIFPNPNREERVSLQNRTLSHFWASTRKNYDEKYIRRLLSAIKKIDVDEYYNKLKQNEPENNEQKRKVLFRPAVNKKIIHDQKEAAISAIEDLLEKICSLDLNDYALESIDQTLNKEFSSQIQPVTRNVKESEIKLSHEDKIYFDLKIQDNKVVKNKSTNSAIFFNAFQNVYLIDDPFILDEWTRFSSSYDEILPFRLRYRDENEMIIHASQANTHRNQLKQIIFSRKHQSVFEKTVIDGDIRDIFNKINEILPGKIGISERDDRPSYITDTYKIKLFNLAAGTKLFAIIKILLEKGKINKDTLLIFDEPESHLHPEWQNAFAEIIVMFIKYLDITVLLTTHSSNFMLAIEAFMRKYKINGKSNFYQTVHENNNEMVRYKCVNDNMEYIYRDFVQYLSKMKNLRDSFMDEWYQGWDKNQ